jgi:hypothetical protein
MKAFRYWLEDLREVIDWKARRIFCRVFGHRYPLLKKLTGSICPRCNHVIHGNDRFILFI